MDTIYLPLYEMGAPLGTGCKDAVGPLSTINSPLSKLVCSEPCSHLVSVERGKVRHSARHTIFGNGTCRTADFASTEPVVDEVS
jgi:hypothetical protein